MNSAVRISAPSRLHFGLLRFSQRVGRSFGGLGMMIDRPRVVVELRPAERWSAHGPFAQRAMEFAQTALDSCPAPSARAFRVEVLEAPAPHTGLGSGTQLALAVAAGVRKLSQTPTESIEALAASVDRGRRSAVGSHGFELGGLIWEIGRQSSQTLGELKVRVETPDEWRVVLATLPHEQGLSGDREATAFERLPAVPPDVTQQLTLLAEKRIIPAAQNGDFDTFAAATYEYGHLAGSQFAAVQGGPFASPQIAAAVERIRSLGVSGVGQSSWGPTIFAFTPNEASAQELMDRLQQVDELADAHLSTSQPNNRGAHMEWVTGQTPAGYSKP